MKDKKNVRVLVTGGAGYIGSHTVLALLNEGYEIIILDNLVYGHRDLVEEVLHVPLIVGDINDRALLDSLFRQYKIDAAIHFAAFTYVGESAVDPQKYYRNNVGGTLTLLEAMRAASVTKVVFSSTCATYGIPQESPITESHPQNPISPYGGGKLMVERMLSDFDTAYDFRSVLFRYFNAAGANPDGLLGEDHAPETHLLPLVLFAAMGKKESVSVFGTDYPTPDGTCIRDYIHVNDLATAHVLGLEYLLSGGETAAFNLGNGKGASIRSVIDTAGKVTGREIKVKLGDRRLGDPPILIGSSEKAHKILGWNPQFPDLSDILSHAWRWHKKRHGGKL
jgi:UDP-glucose 4-epimerase